MHRTIIKLKNNIPNEKAQALAEMAMGYFDNRAGKVDNSSTDPYVLIFEGNDEMSWQTIDLGTAELADTDFLSSVDSWEYSDTEAPWDNCDVLRLYLYGEE